MTDLPTGLIVSAIIVCAAILFYGAFLYVKKQNKKSEIAAVKNGQNVFLSWNYEPEEWKAAAEDRFGIKPRRLLENGRVYFTDRYVLVTNGAEDVLFELVGRQKFVKHLTEVYLYRDAPMDVIRFEVRTKTIKRDEYGKETMEEDCEVETFYVPVPKSFQAESKKVINFYQEILDKNADAVAAVMPYGLGLFGK